MSRSGSGDQDGAMVVLSHVTPWGFAVALPLALAFAYLGASALDIDLLPHGDGPASAAPLWLFSVPLVGFALFLFLIGVGELASWLKPGVALIVDEKGVATFGIAGERRIAWDDIAAIETSDGSMTLRGKRKGAVARTVRLYFNRLDAEPLVVADQIQRRHRERKAVPSADA